MIVISCCLLTCSVARLVCGSGDQARIPDEHLERLVALRPLGVRVASLVDWAERSLQRVPPELLSERWLLAAGDLPCSLVDGVGASNVFLIFVAP